MCGISGFWGSPQTDALRSMVEAMRHRGPDDSGVYYDDRCSIGMARLAIVDLSPSGHQPMSTPDGGLHIVYNGEMYNFIEERERLIQDGVSFSSNADTEVVLRLYERHGRRCLERMRGMFAFAVYDRRQGRGRETLFLARDQLGIKPLLYAEQNGRLLFASELKALYASGLVVQELEPEALRQLLAYGAVIQPRTIQRGVSMLPPGHWLEVDGSGSRIERYWAPSFDRHPELADASLNELTELFETELSEAVRLQMISDAPLGAFLSGGIDSSLLVALMKRHAEGRVKTFSVGFEGEGEDIDESADAAKMAKWLDVDHENVTIGESDALASIEKISWSLDQPSVDGANAWFVSQAARRQVTVSISGTGGDELFAGYPWFWGMDAQERLDRQRPWRARLKRGISRAATQSFLDPSAAHSGSAWLRRIRNGGSFAARCVQYNLINDETQAARLLSPDLANEARAGAAMGSDLDFMDEATDERPVNRVAAFTLRGYTCNQLLRDIDGASMGHSLEVRVPFLDPRIVDLALSMPDHARMDGKTSVSGFEGLTYDEIGAKRLLIEIGKRHLPPGYERQPKRGFRMPFDNWLNGALRPVLEDCLSEASVSQTGWLNPQEAGRVKDDFFCGRISWTKPWLLMMIELWKRTVWDGAGAKEPTMPVVNS